MTSSRAMQFGAALCALILSGCSLDFLFNGGRTDSYMMQGNIVRMQSGPYRIYGYYFQASASEAPSLTNRTVIFHHGINNDLRSPSCNKFINLIRDLGVNLLIYDYRGYGMSEGVTTEEGTYEDGAAAWDYAVNTLGLDSNNIVQMGYSLGTGIAVEMCQRRKARALILAAAYSSMDDMVEFRSGLDLPSRWFISFKYDSYSKIGAIGVPLLSLHGTKDDVVPFTLGVKLYERAVMPKDCLWIEGAAHQNVMDYNGGSFRAKVFAFLTNL